MTEPLRDRVILVVEDEMMIMMMVEDMLADLGASAVAARSGAEALERLATRRFDAAMLDLRLEDGDSYEVARALAARGVPFLFSTGSSLHDLSEEFSRRPVLRKPFTYPQLAGALVRLLRPA